MAILTKQEHQQLLESFTYYDDGKAYSSLDTLLNNSSTSFTKANSKPIRAQNVHGPVSLDGSEGPDSSKNIDDKDSIYESNNVRANHFVNKPLFVMAHGAGADSHSEWIETMARNLSLEGMTVVTFDFPYMSKRQQDGKKRPPDRQPKLLTAYLEVIRHIDRPCWVGGKSMGGRMSSYLVAEDDSLDILEGDRKAVLELIEGFICFGYPFHALGKPEKLRIEHFHTLMKPGLICQGTRDVMGNYERVEALNLTSNVQLNWYEDGDHDLKARVKSGIDFKSRLRSVARDTFNFIQSDSSH